MKVLIVSPFPLLPVRFGGQKDVFEKLKIFYSLGYKVDLVYCGKQLDKSSQELILNIVDKLFWVNREERVKHVFSIIPYQAKSREALKDFVFNEYYDLILLEGEYVGEILKNSTLKYKRLVLRVHNDEINYFKNLAYSVLPKFSFFFYYSEFLKFKSYLSKIHKRIDEFWCVSTEEAQMYSSRYINVKHLPIVVDMDEFYIPEFNKDGVLFIGALNMPNNIQGLKWYLNKVHPIVKNIKPNYKFTIVGSTKGTDVSWLKKLEEKDSNISVNFDVDNLEQFYKGSCVFVNPMLHGAGVKVKTVSAIVKGLAVVSTKIGAEGIGLESGINILIENDYKRFAYSIIDLMNNHEFRITLAQNAQDFIKEGFDIPIKIKQYISEMGF